MAESRNHRQFPPNRLILLASTAILGATVLLAGPGGYSPFNLSGSIPSADAAESTLTHPTGFADLVAKVKPAVISVRVKIDKTAKMTGMSQNENNNIPFSPGSPMDKFFQQFGFPLRDKLRLARGVLVPIEIGVSRVEQIEMHLTLLLDERIGGLTARQTELLVAARQGEFEPPAHLRSRIHRMQMRGGHDAVSSTEVRERIARGEPWQHLVPEEIVARVREIYS